MLGMLYMLCPVLFNLYIVHLFGEAKGALRTHYIDVIMGTSAS